MAICSRSFQQICFLQGVDIRCVSLTTHTPLNKGVEIQPLELTGLLGAADTVVTAAESDSCIISLHD